MVSDVIACELKLQRYGLYMAHLPSAALLAGPKCWQWFQPLKQELLVDICKRSLLRSFCLNQQIYAGLYTNHMNYFDKKIALILSSKGVIILKQLKKALERCDISQNVGFFHENCASGQWIQPQKVPLGIDRGSIIGNMLKKMNETTYIWNLMIKTLLNWGPSWWKYFSI